MKSPIIACWHRALIEIAVFGSAGRCNTPIGATCMDAVVRMTTVIGQKSL